MSTAASVFSDRATSAQSAGTETSSTIWTVGGYRELVFLVAASSVSGTLPILDVKVQTSDTNTSTATWYDLSPVQKVQLTSATNKALRVTEFGKYVRTSRTVSGVGTPTVTYTIQLVAKT